MTMDPAADRIELVPVDRVTVLNPRMRNKKKFREVVESISDVGLKRPITVTRRDTPEGTRFELVCGQGRLEAYQVLGQAFIPAIVIDAPAEDCMVMSLVENLARRRHRAIDLLHDIAGLKRRGYTEGEIARKTGLTVEYVKGVIRLLDNGEHRLLRAVEAGHVPVSIAVDIAEAADGEVQAVLQQAYESKLLRGRKLLFAKRLIEQRLRRGKGLRSNGSRRTTSLSSNALVRAYKEDVDRKRILIRKANAAHDRLVFIVQALRTLLSDDAFVSVLRAEGIDSVPRNLAERIQTSGQA